MSFYITVSNGLLEKKHRMAIGPAIWVFMWCIEKMTKIDHDEGTGLLLGGKHIKLQEIADELGIERTQTVSEHLNRLEKAGYLSIEHKQYGMVIIVNNAKKSFGRRVTQKREPDTQKRKPEHAKAETSLYTDSIVNKVVDTSDAVASPFSEDFVEEETIEPDEDFMPTKKVVRKKAIEAGSTAHQTNPLIEWAQNEKGARFPAVLKQKKSIAAITQAGFTPDEIKAEWDRLEADEWYGANGVDFAAIRNTIGKVRKQKSNQGVREYVSKDVKQ